MTLMVYFGPYTESGHFMFYEGGAKVPYRVADTLTPWGERIDGTVQPGMVYWRERWTHRGQMREGDAVLHTWGGWTALSIWDSSVDTRSGCSSTYIAEGVFTFDEMVEMAKARFTERWNRMKFTVQLTQKV